MFVVLDTETTGLYVYKGHEMISYAGIKLDKDLKEIDRLHIRIKPQKIEVADPTALRINGYNKHYWENALEPTEASEKIADFMRDCIPVAHNWDFDRTFILSMFRNHAPHCKILRRGIDTVTLASSAFLPYGYKSVSMQQISEIMGWPKQPHRALEDTLYCVQLFRLLYPVGIKSAIKVHAVMLRAKMRPYLNPLTQ